MSVDLMTVKHIAHLARIALNEKEAQYMSEELSAMMGLLEQLDEIDIENVVEPMTSVTSMRLRMREDVITDGNNAEDVIANAPVKEENFFLVPKIIE
ncbi:MAG: aspartyl-tRNA(Asn)/glutamyl-tRNA(Gln) amidotransferase subunit C [Candidatus Tokpelaia sp. JSC188]|nr:MAG: aspartyl-tRNA(Asn)/glutamyl-tRNA(Gln) amidotransferase subunit C [Candidatus Tokpelaia sp. JSC188]